ncbi:uncharacterized protein LOC132974322 [Labrus mixtus]|uniref:uncharacterized protein LOC132974322 n=1 Tax=Labrus mixtus TaxID=508554 RepID=UPI0029C06C6C|nr:uncharacterized protein LOC132974322 [Labrus mixtus]
MVRHNACITAEAEPIRLSISRSILPSLVNKTPRYLNSSTWGKDSLPTRRAQSTYFRQRTMASDLEVLTLIPAASHSAANHPNACWRFQLEEANKTTSSAKSRDEILRSPNWKPSSPRLLLEILFLKITNRIGDKRQPWRRPTRTGNVSDFVPRMWTQLPLWSYRDRMARTNGTGAPYSRSTPHMIPEGHGQKPFPNPQNTCRLDEQISMLPQEALRG